jgi:hypothetical protein
MRVLSRMRRAHAQLFRFTVHAALVAARRAFDCTLAFLIRGEHCHMSKSVARTAARQDGGSQLVAQL